MAELTPVMKRRMQRIERMLLAEDPGAKERFEELWYHSGARPGPVVMRAFNLEFEEVHLLAAYWGFKKASELPRKEVVHSAGNPRLNIEQVWEQLQPRVTKRVENALHDYFGDGLMDAMIRQHLAHFHDRLVILEDKVLEHPEEGRGGLFG